MKASRTEIERALDNPPPHIRLFLLYGPDESESLSLAMRLERSMGSSAERVDLDGPSLKADPARLADEAAAMSLFGDRRHIRVSVTGDEAMPAVEGLLAAPAAGNPVVILAGALKPSSALLKRSLADPAVMACISYPLDAEKSAPVAAALAREHGLRLDRETAQALASAASHDRGLIAREVEKLALFLDTAPDRPGNADLSALEAIGAGEGEADLSTLVDSVLGGQPDLAARETARLGERGVSGIPAIRAIARRVQLLARLADAVADGRSPRSVVEAQGKSIFWKEKANVERQLGLWSPERLARLSDRLLEAERAIKASGSAGDILADVELITVARAARRYR